MVTFVISDSDFTTLLLKCQKFRYRFNRNPFFTWFIEKHFHSDGFRKHFTEPVHLFVFIFCTTTTGCIRIIFSVLRKSKRCCRPLQSVRKGPETPRRLHRTLVFLICETFRTIYSLPSEVTPFGRKNGSHPSHGLKTVRCRTITFLVLFVVADHLTGLPLIR